MREDLIRSLTDGRYEASLPWKPLDQGLASNEAVARERLDNLMRRVRPNKDSLMVYDAAIRDFLDQGFADYNSNGITEFHIFTDASRQAY